MRPFEVDATRWAAFALLVVMLATAAVLGARSPLERNGRVAAHAAAGVSTTGLSTVQTAFHQEVESLRARVRADPNNIQLLLGLARLLHDGHLASEAIAYYRAAIRLDPSLAQPYYDLAAAYAETNDWAGASRVLRERLLIDPQDAVAMYDLGATLANQGETGAAREWWTRVSRAASDPNLRSRSEQSLEQLDRIDPP
jgi:tetratricopeptide (TPR) repeat protein